MRTDKEIRDRELNLGRVKTNLNKTNFRNWGFHLERNAKF